MKIERVSASQLRMFERCAVQWEYRYGKGIISPPDLGLLSGRAVHAGAAHGATTKAETGEIPALDLVQQTVRDTLRGDTEAGEWTPGPDWEEFGSPREALGAAIDSSMVLAAEHHEHLLPQLQPEWVELRLEVPADDVVPVATVGVVDLVERGDRLSDLKTSKRMPPADAAEQSAQLTFYKMQWDAVFPDRPLQELRLDYVVRTPSGRTGHRSLATQRDDEDVRILARRIERLLVAADREVFAPTSQDNWWCSARWCGYARQCPYFRGRPRPAK